MSKEKAHSALMEAISRAQKMTVVPAKVTAVDEKNYTCDVEPVDGGAPYFNVRLRAAINDGDFGVVLIPAEKSDVLIGIVNNDDRKVFVCGWSRVKRMFMMMEDGSIQMFGTTVELNGADFTTLKGAETMAEVSKLDAQVKALLGVIGSASIPEPGNGAPSALQQALNGAVSALQKPSFTELENDKVKHGAGS